MKIQASFPRHGKTAYQRGAYNTSGVSVYMSGLGCGRAKGARMLYPITSRPCALPFMAYRHARIACKHAAGQKFSIL